MYSFTCEELGEFGVHWKKATWRRIAFHYPLMFDKALFHTVGFHICQQVHQLHLNLMGSKGSDFSSF